MKDTKNKKRVNNEPKWKKKKEERAKNKIVLDIGVTGNAIEDALDDTSSMEEIIEAVEKHKEFAGEDSVDALVSNVAMNKKEEIYAEPEIELPKGITKEDLYGTEPLAEGDEESIQEEYQEYTFGKDVEPNEEVEVAEEDDKFTGNKFEGEEDSSVEEEPEVEEPIEEVEETKEEEPQEETTEETSEEETKEEEPIEEQKDEEPTEEVEEKPEEEPVEEEEKEEPETEEEKIEKKLSHTSPLESVQNIIQEIEKNPEIENELERTHDYDVFEPYKKKEEIRLNKSTTTLTAPKKKEEKEPRKKIDLKQSWNKAVHYNYASRIATLLGIILLFFILFVVFLFKAFGYEMGGSSTYSEYTTNDYYVCSDSTNEYCTPKDREYKSYDVDHINVKFTYDAKYSSSVSFDAKYYIAARLRIYDANDKTRLKYTKEDMIIDKTPLTIGGEVINFSSDAYVDYKTYRYKVASYIAENGEDASATLEVALYLDSEDVARKISYITIPLTEDTFDIAASNLDNQNQLVVYNTVDSTVDPFYIFISIICVLMDLLLFLYLYNFVSMINHLDSKYTIKLRRILKEYDKYIVNANNEYSIPEDVRVVDVDRIEELVDARNSLDKPIVYEKINNIKSKFYVEDGNIVYCYTLKDDE